MHTGDLRGCRNGTTANSVTTMGHYSDTIGQSNVIRRHNDGSKYICDDTLVHSDDTVGHCDHTIDHSIDTIGYSDGKVMK